MDELIKRFDSEPDDDLRLCLHRGVAYQADMKITAKYDSAYFDKCAGYEGQKIANAINAARVALVNEHITPTGRVLDIGVGSGEFIKRRNYTWGYDINPAARHWLQIADKWSEDFAAFDAFTLWDVIEHVPHPNSYFRALKPGGYLFTSIPIFDDLRRIRESKHYRPGEHLYYWTREGFLDWMGLYGFECLDHNAAETEAGRESIVSFAFKKSERDFNYYIGQYETIHSSRHYGASAGLYLEWVAPHIFQLNPESILDYGCGRSDLVAHFWKDGRRRLARYDPAIPQYKEMPRGPFDLVLCCDVMEHIRMADVDRVLTEVRSQSKNAIFVISLKPARAHLPDGANAHITLLTESEWTRWLASYFGKAWAIPVPWKGVLMIKTFG